MPTIYISDTGFKEMLKSELQYQKAGGDKVQPHSALPHMPEAVTAFLQMVFGVLECQLAAPQPQSLQPASYKTEYSTEGRLQHDIESHKTECITLTQASRKLLPPTDGIQNFDRGNPNIPKTDHELSGHGTCITIIYILSTNARNMRHNTSDMGMPYR